MGKLAFIIKISLFASLFLISCKSLWYRPPNFIKKEFSFLHDGKATQIDSIIDINGYYQESSIWTRAQHAVHQDVFGNFSIDTTNAIILIDTFKQGMMFFKDGICVSFVQDDSYSYIPSVVKDDSLGTKNNFYDTNVWGSYFIFGDTIKVKVIDRPILYSSNRGWRAYEIWYKAINRTTLQRIDERPIYSQQSDIDLFYNHYQKGRIYLPAIFTPTKGIPTSDGWIKNEKWFWEKDEDWRKYMDNLKMLKKQKKEYK